jgi:hypothetical protein
VAFATKYELMTQVDWSCDSDRSSSLIYVTFGLASGLVSSLVNSGKKCF